MDWASLASDLGDPYELGDDESALSAQWGDPVSIDTALRLIATLAALLYFLKVAFLPAGTRDEFVSALADAMGMAMVSWSATARVAGGNSKS